MNRLAPRHIVRLAIAIVAVGLWPASAGLAADIPGLPHVDLAVNAAGPRTVETLTVQSVVRDYQRAWQSLADSFRYGEPTLLSGYFVGPLRTTLSGKVTEEARSGLHSQYLNQSHKLEVVFYAPEGDVMELRDTAEFDLQIADGSKTISREKVVSHYVVLMTPSADRWMVRELQEVRNF